MVEQQKKWITFRVSAQEMRAIEAYCSETSRTKTDVIRELIRKLPTYTHVAGDETHGNFNQMQPRDTHH